MSSFKFIVLVPSFQQTPMGLEWCFTLHTTLLLIRRGARPTWQQRRSMRACTVFDIHRGAFITSPSPHTSQRSDLRSRLIVRPLTASERIVASPTGVLRPDSVPSNPLPISGRHSAESNATCSALASPRGTVGLRGSVRADVRPLSSCRDQAALEWSNRSDIACDPGLSGGVTRARRIDQDAILRLYGPHDRRLEPKVGLENGIGEASAALFHVAHRPSRCLEGELVVVRRAVRILPDLAPLSPRSFPSRVRELLHHRPGQRKVLTLQSRCRVRRKRGPRAKGTDGALVGTIDVTKLVVG